MNGSIMFYNGFNLLIDIIIGFIVWKFAFSAGRNEGIQIGEDITHDWYNSQQEPPKDYFDDYFANNPMSDERTDEFGDVWVKKPF